MTRDPKAQWASQGRRVREGTWGWQEWQDKKEKKAHQGHQGCQAPREHLGLEAVLGLKGPEGQEVGQGPPARKASPVSRDSLAGMDRQDLRGHQGLRDQEEWQVLQGWMDLVGLLDPLAQLVHRGFQDYLLNLLDLLNPLNLPNLLNLPSVPNPPRRLNPPSRQHKQRPPFLSKASPLSPQLQCLVSTARRDDASRVSSSGQNVTTLFDTDYNVISLFVYFRLPTSMETVWRQLLLLLWFRFYESQF